MGRCIFFFKCKVDEIRASKVYIIQEAEVLRSDNQLSKGFAEIAEVCRCAWGIGQNSSEK